MYIFARLAQLGEHHPYLANLQFPKECNMKNSKEVGNLTELQCITALYELGCDVSIPFGNSQKYDVVIDYNNKLYRVQIKHANEHWENDELAYFSFKTRWQGHNTSGYTMTAYTENDIEFFATYCQGQLFLIPVNECSGTVKNIRFKPPKNGQVKGINFAKDYLAEDILKKL